ncbi:MAG TPA: response regulator transcription factor [Solirubrobacteraceae bacterium]|jgi:DNA-binding response OmpR family regulator
MTVTDRPILLVEVDRAYGERLAGLLAADGFSVELARSAAHARTLAAESSPRLALLGALPAPRGSLALLEEIRACGEEQEQAWDRLLPALVLGSGAPPELEALRAFEAGADDFVAAPASYLELRARMRALLRRADGEERSERLLAVRGLLIDRATRAATLRGRQLELRRMEYELLARLATEPRRVFTRQELLNAVWGYRSSAVTRTLDSHASRLRRKLQEHDEDRWVLGVRGVGYRLI